MADVTYRGNLKAASFPFLSELFGRTVIVKGQDQNYVGTLAAKDSTDSSVGVPQLYYCHNVIPIDNGYASVGYDTYAAAQYPNTAGFTSGITLRDDAGHSATLSMDAVGNVYVMEKGSTTWAIPTGGPAAASVAGKRITVAFVSGVTYIYFQNVGCYTYSWATGQFSSVTLNGLTAADIIGIVASGGYHVAYSKDALAWSSVIDPTDFVPDLATGAGGGSVEGLQGEIVTIESVYGGLIVFASENAVAALASGNPRYPYSFNPITGCGGLTSPYNTAQDTGSGTVYAYTTSGLQAITLRNATTQFPEVTDFISGNKFEDFNELTLEFTLTDTSGSELQKRIAMIADRYLIISYGLSSLTHAIYYDTLYKQFGRLKIDHVDCFEFNAHASGTAETPKHSIAFLGAGGSIQILTSDLVFEQARGVMILGKYQYVRTRFLQLQAVEFENVYDSNSFALYDLPTLDGKTFLPAVQGYDTGRVGLSKEFKFHNTALNHSILCIGRFTGISILLTFNVSGGR